MFRQPFFPVELGDLRDDAEKRLKLHQPLGNLKDDRLILEQDAFLMQGDIGRLTLGFYYSFSDCSEVQTHTWKYSTIQYSGTGQSSTILVRQNISLVHTFYLKSGICFHRHNVTVQGQQIH